MKDIPNILKTLTVHQMNQILEDSGVMIRQKNLRSKKAVSSILEQLAQNDHRIKTKIWRASFKHTNSDELAENNQKKRSVKKTRTTRRLAKLIVKDKKHDKEQQLKEVIQKSRIGRIADPESIDSQNETEKYESPALSKAKPTRKSRLAVKPTQITKGSRISRMMDKITLLRQKSGSAFSYMLQKIQSSVKKIKKPFSRRGKQMIDEGEEEKYDLPVKRQLKLDELSLLNRINAGKRSLSPTPADLPQDSEFTNEAQNDERMAVENQYQYRQNKKIDFSRNIILPMMIAGASLIGYSKLSMMV